MLLLVAELHSTEAIAGIPATPLMTVYRFGGPLEVAYYDAASFGRDRTLSRTGALAQGTSVIPCLVVRDGRPLTDRDGTPYVGFEVVVDSRRATPASNARFTEVSSHRKSMTVADHHCPPGTDSVIDVRNLYALDKPPQFDPPRAEHAGGGRAAPPGQSELDTIVRAFHDSPECAEANRELIGRRDALRRAWDAFVDANRARWSASSLARARHLDYVMRTALYEGHLGRGCSAYGACERDVIALSIRNRGRERCARGQGCKFDGDFEGVASSVSQYNIWNEYLTQTSGLTACFLRPDLAAVERTARLQTMYAQNVGDVERILFGDESDLAATFPGSSLADLTRLRHYYHPPAMGKCFPDEPRLEYISGAVAERDGHFALIANTRILVDEPRGRGYLFRQAAVDEQPTRDVVRGVDRYPGFVIDGRKVSFGRSSGCTPFGVPRGCRFDAVGLYRKTPGWLSSGDAVQLTCRVRSRGEDCRGAASAETVRVGGPCDVAMQPIAGVPEGRGGPPFGSSPPVRWWSCSSRARRSDPTAIASARARARAGGI
jgi:hypothetical protein